MNNSSEFSVGDIWHCKDSGLAHTNTILDADVYISRYNSRTLSKSVKSIWKLGTSFALKKCHYEPGGVRKVATGFGRPFSS